jgi:hypothetical protein
MKFLAQIVLTIWLVQVACYFGAETQWTSSPWWMLFFFGLMFIWGRVMVIIMALGTAMMIGLCMLRG